MNACASREENAGERKECERKRMQKKDNGMIESAGEIPRGEKREQGGVRGHPHNPQLRSAFSQASLFCNLHRQNFQLVSV